MGFRLRRSKAVASLLVGRVSASDADWTPLPWTKHLLLAALIGLLVHFVRPAAAAETQPVPDVFSVPATVPDHRGTESRPLIVSKPVEELNRDDVDRVDHATNERWVAMATVVLAVFTALLWGANIWLVVATNRVSARQAADTQRAISEANRSATAMEAVAQATTSNAIMMREIFAKQMRAYLSVEGGTAWAQTATALFQGVPVITNNGLTPARNVCFRVLAGILDGTTGPPGLPEIGDLIINDMAIAPRQRFTALSPVVPRVSDEDADLIAKGATRRLFVWGRITYDDVFDGHWTTNFCLSYHFWTLDGKLQVGSTFSPRHNDST
jgi:hypothetical protein